MLLPRKEITQRRSKLLTKSEQLASYRIARLVTDAVIYGNGDAYSVCPRCHCALDREYIRFCTHCGQRLGWEGPMSVDTSHPRLRNRRR